MQWRRHKNSTYAPAKRAPSTAPASHRTTQVRDQPTHLPHHATSILHVDPIAGTTTLSRYESDPVLHTHRTARGLPAATPTPPDAHVPQHTPITASRQVVTPHPSRPVPTAVADEDDDVPAHAPSAHNTGAILSIETIDPLTGERTFMRFDADSAPPASRTAAHSSTLSATPGQTQPPTTATQVAPHAFATSHSDLQQTQADHHPGTARRTPANTPAAGPPSAHASRTAAASALSLAGIPPHATPDQHNTHTTPRSYKPPAAATHAPKPPLSAAAVATARARAAAALDPPAADEPPCR